MKPLQGLRVLSIEQFGAAPYATMFLADMGAEVIKLENLESGGDPARYTGPYRLGEADSQYFQTWNSNKKSITLDLKSAEGRAQFERLAADMDAVVDNLRGDQPAKLRLQYADLKHLNPRLVCLHISAYGRDNERAAWPGYDYLMQAETGLMHLTGEPDGPPSRFGAPSIIDQTTGLTAAVGLLGAILGARSSGIGCDVDTCLFDVALHQLGYAATWYLNEGAVTPRQARSGHLSVGPVQTFATADGWIFIMCMTQKFWLALLDALGRTDLLARPEFATPTSRGEHRQTLTPLLDAELRKHGTRFWLDRLGGLLPVAPVNTLVEALESPAVRDSGVVRQVPHPLRPDFRMLANPLRFDGQRLQQAVCAPLGADNEELLPSRVDQGAAP
ncbi:CoA transferase [Xylophilus rhododendri]|uniref:CoA transferase n=1 Tax=Xylophilus rhododendri TaxID=2697032 RepID=A0A857J2C0_9BURK|nr:CoA transferase [Xylophilus rhododendri]QHI97211.1 CoA transferase [Xylophilus rhododendri]